MSVEISLNKSAEFNDDRPVDILSLKDCGEQGEEAPTRLYKSEYTESSAAREDSKIKTLKDLSGVLRFHRSEGRKIVHCHGVFDLLHRGHTRYFEQARRMGDLLVVTITPDHYLDQGPHRPAFTDNIRAEALASLNCVDYVAINQWPTSEETLRLLQPDIYVKGFGLENTASDKPGKVVKEEQVIHEVGASLAITEDIFFNSTSQINKHTSNLLKEVPEYPQVHDWQTNVQKSKDTLESLSVWDSYGSEIEVDLAFTLWRDRTIRMRKTQKTVYLIGNGASASMASHMAADLAKNAQVHTEVFSDISLITAIANDISYDEVFAEPIRRRMKAGDMLIAISSSGRSKNIIRAAQEAAAIGGFIVSVSAMKPDNILRSEGNINFYVPAQTYGLAESCHAAILHYWMDFVEKGIDGL